MTPVSDPAVFVLTGPEGLSRLRSPSTRRTIRRITVDPGVGPGAEQLERDLNRWYFACGCEQGSVAVMAAIAVSGVCGLRWGFNGPLTWWLVVAYVAAGALIGKLAGIAYAKTRLRRTYRKLPVC